MKAIGGYYGLELSERGEYLHQQAFQFQTGRAALYFILANAKPGLIYVPFYTCNALLQPMIDLGISYQFYAINEHLELSDQIILRPNEFLVYINYFDCKQAYVHALSAQYGNRLIVDNSQAYFNRGNGVSWYFNSARKFFGVPDGADLYTPRNWDLKEKYRRLYANTIYSIEHLVARFNGRVEEGYDAFIINEELVGVNYDRMSVISHYLLSQVDFESARRRRMVNFNYVHEKLSAGNQLKLGSGPHIAPSYYPYLPARAIEKKHFWAEQLFIPSLWQDCLNRVADRPFGLEKMLSTYLLPIPVDHRYERADLDRIINFILNANENELHNKI